MVTRADLLAYLRRPVGDIPFEAVGCDLGWTKEGDNAHVLFEIICSFRVFFFILARLRGGCVRPVSPRGVNDVPPRVEDERDAFFRDKVQVQAELIILGMCGPAPFRIESGEMMDLRKGLVDTTAQSS